MSLSHLLRWFITCLLALTLLVYGADWLLRVRVAHGGGTQDLEVSRVSVAPLKAGKEEYYFEGTDTVTCTRSLLPLLSQGSLSTPCWWLAGHRQRIVRY